MRWLIEQVSDFLYKLRSKRQMKKRLKEMKRRDPCIYD